jgi:hypothetical protein
MTARLLHALHDAINRRRSALTAEVANLSPLAALEAVGDELGALADTELRIVNLASDLDDLGAVMELL